MKVLVIRSFEFIGQVFVAPLLEVGQEVEAWDRWIGWKPKTDTRTPAATMVDPDLKLAERGMMLCEAGQAEASCGGYR